MRKVLGVRTKELLEILEVFGFSEGKMSRVQYGPGQKMLGVYKKSGAF